MDTERLRSSWSCRVRAPAPLFVLPSSPVPIRVIATILPSIRWSLRQQYLASKHYEWKHLKLSPPENTAGESDRRRQWGREENGMSRSRERKRERWWTTGRKKTRDARALDDAPAFKPIVSHLTHCRRRTTPCQVLFQYHLFWCHFLSMARHRNTIKGTSWSLPSPSPLLLDSY